MKPFRVAMVEHAYGVSPYEREIIEAAGGELLDPPDATLEQRIELCKDADGILVNRLAFTRDLICQLRRAKIILRYGVGVDNVDLKAATEKGIIVGHVPIYCQDEVSAHAVALLLAAARHIVRTHKRIEQGGWHNDREDRVHRFSSKTIGFVGFGTLGQSTAQKLQGWGMRLLACDPFLEPERAQKLNTELVPLEQLLAESDYISLHTPLLPETVHLINRKTLAQMKRGSILVNTARGPIVDGQALIEALDSGHLAAAALDVFEEEPLPQDSPLRVHPKITVTDHMAWYSEEAQIQLRKTAAEEVVRACAGMLPRAIANPDVLKTLGRESEWEPNSMARWQAKRREILQNRNP